MSERIRIFDGQSNVSRRFETCFTDIEENEFCVIGLFHVTCAFEYQVFTCLCKAVSVCGISVLIAITLQDVSDRGFPQGTFVYYFDLS